MRNSGPIPTFLLSLTAILLHSPAYAAFIDQLWSLDTSMIMEGSPITIDLDNDGDAEIITAAYENIIAIDGNGKELWRFDTPGRYQTCPAIFERDGQPPLIYAGDNHGAFTCLDGLGNVVWHAEIAPVFCSTPAIADLTADGSVEVVQSDKSGAVNVFDALTGKPVWTKPLEGECSSVAIADLNNDGSLEIALATSTGKIFALNSSGDVLWNYDLAGTTPDWATCSPIVFHDSHGTPRVACASGKERVVCLDAAGKPLWEHSTRGAVASTLSAGDFDADGRADLFAVTQLGILYRFDETGKTIWDIDTQGRSLAPGAIIDIDGDGKLDYVLCTQNGGLFVFNQEGAITFSHQFNNRTINVTPSFGDIMKERPGLEFSVTGGESGKLFCFSTSAPVDAQSPWRTYRGDVRLNAFAADRSRASVARMHPQNLAWDQLLTRDAVRFDIANPGGETLNAEVMCLRPDGSRQSAVSKVAGTSGVLEMPLAITAPGVYEFEWSLRGAGGENIATGSRSLTLQPFANDNALVQRALLAVQFETGGTLAHKALSAESQSLIEEHAALTNLQAAMPGANAGLIQEIENRTESLNFRARRALALANAASDLEATPGAQLVAFTTDTWESRDVNHQLPKSTNSYSRIHRRCVTGEHEPVSIKLMNVTSETVSVTAGAAPSNNGPVATMFQVKQVPANVDTVAWDPIVPLRDGPIEIPGLESREVWIDLDLAHAKPGEYTTSVTFDTGSSTVAVQIVLEVLPFEMAAYENMRLCCWAQYNEHVVKDLLAHGNTVFIATLPSASIGEDGSTVSVDFVALDKFVAPLKGHDVYLLFNGIPSLGVPEDSAEYVPRLANYLDQLFVRLKAAGINEDRVAMYPYDEPGGHGWDTVRKYTAFARQGLKARPALKFYINGGGDLPMFKEFAEVAGVWCPAFFMLADESPEMDLLRKSGKTLWSYDCAYTFSRPIGANTKATNVVAQYRLAPIIAMNYGATGLGYWSYNIGEPMWGRVQFEYPLVYANSDGTTTSCRRWEAVREGMEDARILLALRAKLEDSAISEAVKSKIRALLNETVKKISAQTMEQARVGVARYVLDASNNDETVEGLREEMLDCVAALAK
ncbi:MAG: PQQ-binding-like beta-propeller repeat protein [Candidatus Hydrogenedentes bacterium]|nr:PQQ-binding-like beta-propeller repeat protein [Candidatus Hydrogenedentota bacterium]